MWTAKLRTPTAALVLADGTAFTGFGEGAPGRFAGELVFNTAMTGYQEIITDPSYADQLVAFTFPHIGNVGVNDEDVEAPTPHLKAIVTRAPLSEPSNWRSRDSLSSWLKARGVGAVSGVDTRRITRHLRDHGAQNAVLHHDPEGRLDLENLRAAARGLKSMEGKDLARAASQGNDRTWRQGIWATSEGYKDSDTTGPHIVVIDYGVKNNILRLLAERACRVTSMAADIDAERIKAHKPDGVLLANGPGDPAATGNYAVREIQHLLDQDIPVFGICLGHQLLSLALGAQTMKMPFGHHGANHPVIDLISGQVVITSQNHGFAVDDSGLPEKIEVTHRSLFDHTIQGIRALDRPAFSVQYHPEASPGPMDSSYLFDRFVAMIERRTGA